MLLYRSPNVIINRHEWHAAVLLRKGRVSLVYRWRPLSLRNYAWSPMVAWQGPKPKGMCDKFWPFRGHIRQAMQSEQARREAVTALRGPDTAAVVLNAGKRRGGRANALLEIAA